MAAADPRGNHAEGIMPDAAPDAPSKEACGSEHAAEAVEGLEPVPADQPACSAEAARMITARSEKHDDCHSKRERIALGVFACLLFAGAVALFSYINAGHGLNVAATTIDDATGDMSDYGVILFEGTVRPDAADETDDEDQGGVQGILSGIFGSDDEEDSASGSGSSGASGASSGASSQDEADSADGDSADSASRELSNGSGGTASSSTTGSSKRSVGAQRDTVTLEDAEEAYQEKGASIISIDSTDLGRYASGRIIMQGGRTYGIFSLTEEDLASLSTKGRATTRITTTTTKDTAGSLSTSTTTRVRNAYSSVAEMFENVDEDDVSPAALKRIEGILQHFEDCGVDTVVALTSDSTPFKYVEGVDVVVTFKQSGRFSMAETIDGTMYFDAPEAGQVGVLMVAPGNVVSAKVMS